MSVRKIILSLKSKFQCYIKLKKTPNLLLFRDTCIKSIKTGMTIINKTMFISLEKGEKEECKQRGVLTI